MKDPNDVSTYSDKELKSAFDEAKIDLENAANTERNSEWHEACFAAVIILAQEIARRRIRM